MSVTGYERQMYADLTAIAKSVDRMQKIAEWATLRDRLIDDEVAQHYEHDPQPSPKPVTERLENLEKELWP